MLCYAMLQKMLFSNAVKDAMLCYAMLQKMLFCKSQQKLMPMAVIGSTTLEFRKHWTWVYRPVLWNSASRAPVKCALDITEVSWCVWLTLQMHCRGNVNLTWLISAWDSTRHYGTTTRYVDVRFILHVFRNDNNTSSPWHCTDRRSASFQSC